MIDDVAPAVVPAPDAADVPTPPAPTPSVPAPSTYQPNVQPGARDGNGPAVDQGQPLPLAEVNVPDRPAPQTVTAPAPADPVQPTPAAPSSAAPQPQDQPTGTPAGRPQQWDNTLYLVVNGNKYAPWLQASVTRGIEIMPSHATFVVTERFPGNPGRADIKAGDPAQVLIGSTPMLTGYVSRRTAKIGPEGNLVTLLIRSASQDLVECSVDEDQVQNLQLQSASPLDMANKIAGCYGMSVHKAGNPDLTPIGQINIGLGERCYDVMEEICRYSALLVYDDTDGTVILAQPGGVGTHASGFTEGVNVEAAQAVDAMDGRYSDVRVYYYSPQSLSDIAPIAPRGVQRDTTVPRFRAHSLISEQNSTSLEVANLRATWEIARRYGRSQPVLLTTDSWRDVSGALWQPNKLVPLSLPHLKIDKVNWIIAEVVFHRDGGGTRADLVLMPKQAFQPQPIIQYAFDNQIAAALPPGGGGAASAQPAPSDASATPQRTSGRRDLG